jgi:FAD-dependent urate hydroxylase
MKRALIVGGGIAGTVAAMALHKAGFDAVVHEAHAADSVRAGGTYLTMAVNGLAALRAVDLRDEVMAAGFPTRTIRFSTGSGRCIGEVPIGPTLPDGTVTHTIRRSDLCGLLHAEARRRGIRIEYGSRLVDAGWLPDGGVHARFADGRDETCDFLVGADGIHSRVRQIIDRSCPEPRYTGLGTTGGFAPAGAAPALPVDTCQMVYGSRMFFGYSISPTGEVWWFANPPNDSELSQSVLSAMTTDEWKQRLIDLCATDTSPASAIIRASQGEVAGRNQYDLPHVPTWHRRSIVIIGDAAHAPSPSSGQGASLAIEDAIVLGRCLRDTPDPAGAFATFERLRRRRVEAVVARGASANRSKPSADSHRPPSDEALAATIQRGSHPDVLRSLAWLFEYHIDWDAPAQSGADLS